MCAAQVWEGKGVVATGRAMIGATNPLASAPGTIRGDYAVDVGGRGAARAAGRLRGAGPACLLPVACQLLATCCTRP
jgi:hypothetical protein